MLINLWEIIVMQALVEEPSDPVPASGHSTVTVAVGDREGHSASVSIPVTAAGAAVAAGVLLFLIIGVCVWRRRAANRRWVFNLIKIQLNSEPCKIVAIPSLS